MANRNKPSYIDLINSFWQIFDKGGLGAFDVALYFLLLKEANYQGWPDTLSYPNRNLVLYSGISEDAISRARNRLKQAGLLDYEAGNRRTAPKYFLFCPLKKGNAAGKRAGNTAGKRAGNTAGNAAGKRAGIYKDYKTKEEEPKGSMSKDKLLTSHPIAREDVTARQMEKKQKFYDSLLPYVEVYGQEMIQDFAEYWTEPNKSATQWRYEQERTWDTARRLKTWAKNDNRFNKTNTHAKRTDYSTNSQQAAQQRAADAAAIVARLAAEDDSRQR